MARWDRFVCVDWSKELAGRQAWVAEIGMRRIAPLEDVTPTLDALLAFARALPGCTVIGIDAALGVPRAYLEGARAAVPAWREASDFLTWLVLACESPAFEREAGSAAAWRHDRPFIAVPAGKGALDAFWTRAGGRLLREIDVATGAKSPFVVSGVPGTVGSGTRVLWAELARLLSGTCDFAVWPFDGGLDAIERRIAIAEIYPRVCYSLALAPELPAPISRLAKTSREVREAAIVALERATWVRDREVALRELELARESEDHFDALMSAAGLLRCALEGRALEGERDVIEGGILGLASVRLT
ncbi:hypothetical protein [Sandaracinus amylolyticus]|uniref:hypothetical protein n=1 Tax=Sandaracinus amylolyticus TaxID=927083 RepID=UPI001F21537D|nr:hypothetical protein [Sandaracinus amylolyticus]UJR85116.1 Hypothetical protein I5071_71960 [Sandaracinus amylolyticus]